MYSVCLHLGHQIAPAQRLSSAHGEAPRHSHDFKTTRKNMRVERANLQSLHGNGPVYSGFVMWVGQIVKAGVINRFATSPTSRARQT